MEILKKINLPSNVKLLLTCLNEAGFEAYVVGGAVRDTILGNAVSDYDITTNALPNQVIDIFKDFDVIETGLQHGTVTVMVEGEGFEITTYRIDGEYLDNRHPESVTFTSNLVDDLSRRDFTVNALACDIDGNIIDAFDGLSDMKNRVIRCVGNADDRFQEDGLRILRALRFAGRLGFTIEKNTSDAVFRNKHLISNISVERIQKEFNGLLSCININSAVKLIDDYFEVICEFIPEFRAVRMNQNNKYHIHNDLVEHTLAVVAGTEPDLILRLAAFFHDFGKPDTYTEEHLETGVQGHFYGHPKVSKDKAIEIMHRLKYSNDEIADVAWLVEHHDNMIAATKRSVKKLLNAAPRIDLVDTLLKLKVSDRADHVNLMEKYPEYIDQIIEIKNDILESNSAFSLKQLAINGYDVMDLGHTGPTVGLLLQAALNAVIDEEVENERDPLLEFLKSVNTEVYINGERL